MELHFAGAARARRTIRCGRCARWSMRCWRSCRRGSPAVLEDGAAVDRAREVAARAAAPGALQRSAASGCSWSSSTTTCCSAGSSGLNMDDPIWDATRVHEEPRAAARTATWPRRSSTRSWPRPRQRQLLSDEHFTVDGTLIEAWAGLKSFQRKDVPPAAAGRSRQPDGELPRRAAEQRDACSRRPIPTRACFARAGRRKPSCTTRATC